MISDGASTETAAAYAEAAWQALARLAIPDAVENAARARALHADALVAWQLDAQACILMKLRGEDARANDELVHLVARSNSVRWIDRWRFLHLFAYASDRIGDPGTQQATDIALADGRIPMAEKGAAVLPKVVSLVQLRRYGEAKQLVANAQGLSLLETESGFGFSCALEFVRSLDEPEAARQGLTLLLEDHRATGFGKAGLVYFLLGEIARRKGDGSEQFHWLQTAIRSDQSRTWWVFERAIQAGYEAGRLGDVFAACAGARLRAKTLSIPMPVPFTAAEVQGLLWVGESARAFDLLHLATLTTVVSPDIAHLDCALAFFYEVQGDLESAAREYQRATIRGESSSFAASLAGAGLVRCLALTGEAANAREACATLEKTPFRQYHAEAALYLAIADHDPESVLLERYDALITSHPRILWRGLALLHLGERLRNRDMLMEALDIFEGAGADPFARRARQAIQDSGFRVSRKRGSKTMLTQRESEVVRLVGEGKSNREIADILTITPRTVAANISAVLEKFGLSSRIDIAIRVASGEWI